MYNVLYLAAEVIVLQIADENYAHVFSLCRNISNKRVISEACFVRTMSDKWEAIIQFETQNKRITERHMLRL
jgi:hypothetical protein